MKKPTVKTLKVDEGGCLLVDPIAGCVADSIEVAVGQKIDPETGDVVDDVRKKEVACWASFVASRGNKPWNEEALGQLMDVLCSDCRAKASAADEAARVELVQIESEQIALEAAMRVEAETAKRKREERAAQQREAEKTPVPPALEPLPPHAQPQAPLPVFDFDPTAGGEES